MSDESSSSDFEDNTIKKKKPFTIEVVSAGFEGGDVVKITIKGKAVIPESNECAHYRGLHIVVVDQKTAKVRSAQAFDTYSTSLWLDDFVSKSGGIRPGNIVIAACKDECTTKLSEVGIKWFEEKMGSKELRKLGYRCGFALIGVFGKPANTLEQRASDKGRKASVSAIFDYAERRRPVEGDGDSGDEFADLELLESQEDGQEISKNIPQKDTDETVQKEKVSHTVEELEAMYPVPKPHPHLHPNLDPDCVPLPRDPILVAHEEKLEKQKQALLPPKKEKEWSEFTIIESTKKIIAVGYQVDLNAYKLAFPEMDKNCKFINIESLKSKDY